MNTPLWRFLNDPRILRGRRTVRICYGYRWGMHRASREVEQILWSMECRLPGSVEVIEIPKDPS